MPRKEEIKKKILTPGKGKIGSMKQPRSQLTPDKKAVIIEGDTSMVTKISALVSSAQKDGQTLLSP
jgi:ubiquinone biosynthesis protein UbiJ